jgi:hypothetical protein
LSLEPTPAAPQPGVDFAWIAFGALSEIIGYYNEMFSRCCELQVINKENVYERLISHWEIIDQGILHPSHFASPENN